MRPMIGCYRFFSQPKRLHRRKIVLQYAGAEGKKRTTFGLTTRTPLLAHVTLGGALCASRQRLDGRSGLAAFYALCGGGRNTRAGWSRCCRTGAGTFSSRRRKLEEDAAFRWSGELPPHVVRVSLSAPGEFQGVVRGDGGSGARDLHVSESCRDEGVREREQAQGDELRCARRRGA